MANHPRLKARGYALLATRRALMQSLAGLPERHVWRSPVGAATDGTNNGVASVGEITRAAWQREHRWLWPSTLAAPQFDEQPDLAGIFYALARYRGVTDELLFQSTDADLDQPHAAAARCGDGELRTLDWILHEIARAELFDAAQVQYARTLLQPGWPGAREAWERAADAYSRSG